MAEITRSLKVKKSSTTSGKAKEDKLQNVQNRNPTTVPIKPVSVKAAKPAAKAKPSRRSKSVDHEAQIGQTQITDFFQRRSSRKVAAQSKAELQAAMEKRILDGTEDGLKVEFFPDKGRGVIATRSFQKGDYVVEYYGELVSVTEAKKREDKYAEDPTVGCYMLYFMFKGRRLCVDATSESGRLGRLVNHKRNGNCVTRCVVFPQDCVVDSKNSGRSSPNEKPRVLLVATRDISPGEEILYDYGDRNPDSLASHPWLAC